MRLLSRQAVCHGVPAKTPFVWSFACDPFRQGSSGMDSQGWRPWRPYFPRKKVWSPAKNHLHEAPSGAGERVERITWDPLFTGKRNRIPHFRETNPRVCTQMSCSEHTRLWCQREGIRTSSCVEPDTFPCSLRVCLFFLPGRAAGGTYILFQSSDKVFLVSGQKGPSWSNLSTVLLFFPRFFSFVSFFALPFG